MVDEVLRIRPAGECRWDVATLGEVMLRLDPGDGRIRTARSFQVWEGGGEYNVARALRKCWGKRATIVTALPRSEVGALVEDLICQGGVDMSHVIWRPYDGIGRTTRVGLNFVEKGFGVRAPLGCSDRGHSAASQLGPGEVDWERLFGAEGVRWFHTGGIFAALAPNTAVAVLEAVQAARRHGAVVSYDLNFRPSLWNGLQDKAAAQAISREILKQVDVLIGSGPDLIAYAGIDIDRLDPSRPALDPANFERAAQAAQGAFPELKVMAATLRDAKSATLNDWAGVLWADGQLYRSRTYANLEIYDRVGGGDGFVSGLACAFLEGKGPQAAVDYGAAHGALVMTTPGDTSMADAREVEALVAGGGAHVVR